MSRWFVRGSVVTYERIEQQTIEQDSSHVKSQFE